MDDLRRRRGPSELSDAVGRDADADQAARLSPGARCEINPQHNDRYGVGADSTDFPSLVKH